jgi:hypothetical protein
MGRQRPPTDEQKTSIFDSKNLKRPKNPTKKGFESGEIAVPRETLEIGTPTEFDPPRPVPVRQDKERSEPIRMISMKTPAEIAADKKQQKKLIEAKKHRAEIRQLSDVVRAKTAPPIAMGNLAPPIDHRQRRGRKVRDWLIWGSVLVIISCVVMMGVWFLAGR